MALIFDYETDQKYFYNQHVALFFFLNLFVK